MVLDEAAVRGVYCPECSGTVDLDPKTMVPDNGWVLELDEDVMSVFAPRMEMDSEEVTAEKVFDADYVTWVGFSPEDNRQRSEEREEIAKRFAGDLKGQFEALKQWALDREKRFYSAGWRKAVQKKSQFH
jgi:hypothetical protein